MSELPMENVAATVVEFFKGTENEPILASEMYNLMDSVGGTDDWVGPFTFKECLDKMVADGVLIYRNLHYTLA